MKSYIILGISVYLDFSLSMNFFLYRLTLDCTANYSIMGDVIKHRKFKINNFFLFFPAQIKFYFVAFDSQSLPILPTG